MKTWNGSLKAPRAMHINFSIFTMLCIAALCSTNAAAQRINTTLLTSQGFTSSSFPSGWTDNGPWSTSVDDNYSWMWSSTGEGGSNGAAMDDIWDYSSYDISTPALNTSSFANTSDSVWVDFDFFWEYNGYDAEIGDQDEFEIDGTAGEQLVSGTVASLYTYKNTSDFNYNVAQSSSSDWRHYHILIPISDRTSSMIVEFVSVPDYSLGLSDAVIDNVTITASYVPPPELALTPKKMNFGTAAAGVGDTLYATVRSIGIVPLTITGTNFTGSSAYSIASGPPNGTVIPVGSSVQYGIQFLPLNSGTLAGTFTLYTTGADSGTQSISLTGIGAVPAVSYSATNMFRGVNVELTDTSAVQYLYVNSTGAGPLNIKSVTFIGPNAADYFFSHLPAGSIQPGGVDSIGVRFVPNIEGQPDAHMVISSTAANIPLDTVALYGVGILPHLAVDSAKSYPLPLTVDFDSVNLGTQSCMHVTLTNPGSDTVAIEKNYLESADFDYSITPITGRDTLIAPGGSQDIQICFTPLQRGTRVATLRVVTDIPHTLTTPPQDTSEFVVNIIGTGIPAGLLAVTGPTSYDSVPAGAESCTTDTIWNLGQAPITITSIIVGTNNRNINDFSIPSNPSVPFILEPNSSKALTVCASPGDIGMDTGALDVEATVGGGVEQAVQHNLYVYGTLIADAAEIGTPLSSLTCDSESASVIVTNNGNVPDMYTASIGGTNAADFTITSQSISPTLQGGGAFTYSIRFTPSKVGAESAQVNITRSSDGAVTGPLTLSGTGGAAIILGPGNAPMTSIGNTSAQFTVTVANNGTCPWTSGATVTVDPQFTCSTGSTTIAAGSSAPFSFTYTPTVAGGTTYPVTFPLSTASSSINVTIATATDAVAATASNGFSLDQNYPNPFNGTSQCEITLPVACMVHLSVIDVEGQVVQTLLNQHYDAGSFEVTLDATGLASGTYYYQMTAGNVTLTKQMVVLK